jgi:hypothetical protein
MMTEEGIALEREGGIALEQSMHRLVNAMLLFPGNV